MSPIGKKKKHDGEGESQPKIHRPSSFYYGCAALACVALSIVACGVAIRGDDSDIILLAFFFALLGGIGSICLAIVGIYRSIKHIKQVRRADIVTIGMTGKTYQSIAVRDEREPGSIKYVRRQSGLWISIIALLAFPLIATWLITLERTEPALPPETISHSSSPSHKASTIDIGQVIDADIDEGDNRSSEDIDKWVLRVPNSNATPFFIYTGQALLPRITIHQTGTVSLTKVSNGDVPYEFKTSYKDNIVPGEATAIIRAEYSDDADMYGAISKSDSNMIIDGTVEVPYKIQRWCFPLGVSDEDTINVAYSEGITGDEALSIMKQRGFSDVVPVANYDMEEKFQGVIKASAAPAFSSPLWMAGYYSETNGLYWLMEITSDGVIAMPYDMETYSSLYQRRYIVIDQPGQPNGEVLRVIAGKNKKFAMSYDSCNSCCYETLEPNTLNKATIDNITKRHLLYVDDSGKKMRSDDARAEYESRR